MKKSLLLIVAAMLTIQASAQQVFQAPVNAIERQGVSVFNQPSVMKAPRKVDLPSNQKVMGNYVSDDLPGAEYAYSLGNAGTYPAATVITPEVTKSFAGGKVVAIRFAVANSIGASRVFITPITASGEIAADAVSIDVESTQAGWNTVNLPEAYELDGTTAFLLGFDYVQAAGAYSFFFVGDVIAEGALVYGNFSQGTGWYDFSSYGQTAVQAIVEKDDFPAYDIVIDEISVTPYAKTGNDLQYTVTAHNFGTSPMSDYDLKFYVDDAEVATVKGSVTLDGEKKTISGSTAVEGLTTGNHTFSVKAWQVNGEAPAANTDDDEAAATFLAYDQVKERTKHVVEQFTSTSCTYCPLGIGMLEKLQAMRTDLEWVSIHGTQNPNYPDPYTFTACNDIFRFMGASSWPSATVNRMFVDNPSIGSGLVLGIGYYEQYAQQVADIYSNILDNTTVPALTTVDVTGAYDADSRKLTIDVSGEGVDNAASILANAKVTVYLLENGLVARQLNQGTWVSDFVHNNVLRQVVTASSGDDITWDGDNFTAHYEVTLNASWKPENMRVVAHVAFDPAKAQTAHQFAILNANSVTLSDLMTGINSVPAADRQADTFFSLDGRQLSAPQRGISIVRQTDGTSRKVVTE